MATYLTVTNIELTMGLFNMSEMTDSGRINFVHIRNLNRQVESNSYNVLESLSSNGLGEKRVIKQRLHEFTFYGIIYKQNI